MTASGLLTGTCCVAKDSVLATVRATGRATGFCRGGVAAACKGATVVAKGGATVVAKGASAVAKGTTVVAKETAERTSDAIGSSVKFLNPFKGLRRCVKGAEAEHGEGGGVPTEARAETLPGATRADLEPRPSDVITAGRAPAEPTAPPEPTTPVEVVVRAPAPVAVEVKPAPAPAPVAVEVKPAPARAPVAVEVKPAPAPVPAPVVADRPTLVEAEPEKLSADVLTGAAQKVIFTRAMSDLASGLAATRLAAAKALADIRHSVAARAIVAHFPGEASAEVRNECINTLTTLGMKEGLPAAERALTDPAASVRLAAVWGVYRLAGKEGAVTIARMFGDENESVRRRAAACAGWLGEESLSSALSALLADSGASVRVAAAESLGKLRSRGAVPALIERLDDADELVRRAALEALETTTNKSMGGGVPTDDEARRRLIARWHGWWKVESTRQ